MTLLTGGALSCTESLPAARSVGLVDVREYLVLKHDGKTVRLPVTNGEALAELQQPNEHSPRSAIPAG